MSDLHLLARLAIYSTTPFKTQQDEANKKLKLEEEKTNKLHKEIEEKDKKFREFATTFINDVSGKLKGLSSAISRLAKGVSNADDKKKVNELGNEVKSSLKDLTDKFSIKDEKKDNGDMNQQNQNKSQQKTTSKFKR